jgi:hypothetical protein
MTKVPRSELFDVVHRLSTFEKETENQWADQPQGLGAKIMP